MSRTRFIAIDWGTTNRRIYVIDPDGAIEQTERDDRGALSIERDRWPAEVADIRARFGQLPILAAGMVGSTRGWVEAPYRNAPATVGDLAANLCWVEPGLTAIVPGVAVREAAAPDVMRGEEVQLLGAVAAGLVPPDAILCQPGTHCKWARMTGGAIASFRTAMTGELFALLRGHSLLGDFLNGAVAPGDDFDHGVALAGERTFLSNLFGERASVLLGFVDKAAISARVSGQLIGTDVIEQGIGPGDAVHILASPDLGELYARAVHARGGTAAIVDSHQAFVAGARALWSLAS